MSVPAGDRVEESVEGHIEAARGSATTADGTDRREEDAAGEVSVGYEVTENLISSHFILVVFQDAPR